MRGNRLARAVCCFSPTFALSAPLRRAKPGCVVDTELGVKTWEAHREVLAGFRRGSFPNGFRAAGWLQLARTFARLKELEFQRQKHGNNEWWRAAQPELSEAERRLQRFENDPRVVLYTIRSALGMESDPDEDPAHRRRDGG